MRHPIGNPATRQTVSPLFLLAAAILAGCDAGHSELPAAGPDVVVAGPGTAHASATTGDVAVDFTGLPAGAGGSVTVTSAGGYFIWLSAPQTVGALAPGLYTLAAGNVVRNGVTYVPAFYRQSLSVAAGTVLKVTVPYAAAGTAPATTGALAVSFAGLPAGTNGSVTVTGPNNYAQLLSAAQTLSNLLPGTYTVAAADVTGGGVTYAASPGTQSSTVTAGTTATATVTYAAPAIPPPAIGSLTVVFSGLPVVAGSMVPGNVTVTGPNNYTQWINTTRTLNNLEPGVYQIAAANVMSGGITRVASPAAQNVTVTAGAAATATVTYSGVSATGALALAVSGLPVGTKAVITVTGPGSFSHTVIGSQTLTGLAAGIYTVTATDVTGSGVTYAVAPSAQNVTVTSGATTTAALTYTRSPAPPPTGALAVAVSGLPSGVGAAITITGPSAFSRAITASQTLSGLAVGAYTIAATNVVGGSTSYAVSPATQSVSVTAGATTAAAVAYTGSSAPPATGTLAVAVSGLPAGISAAITVTGPAAFSSALTASQTLAGLVAGSYTIAAANVTQDGTVYTASPATRSYAVTGGTLVSASVVYTTSSPPAMYPAYTPGLHPRTLLLDGVTYRYQLFIPVGYSPSVPKPVILSAHGSGEEGSDNVAQLNVGLGPYVTAHASTFPAIVIFPQIPANHGGYSGQAISDFERRLYMLALTQTLAEVNADQSRIYLNGNSIGGVRAWELLYRYPATWAGAVITSAFIYGPGLTGSTSTSNAQGIALAASKLAAMPIRTYHGSADLNDPATGYIEDRDINAAFHGPTATFRYTEYAGLSHSAAWTAAYNDPVTWSWLFAQHR